MRIDALDLLGMGHSQREVARQLGISQPCVQRWAAASREAITEAPPPVRERIAAEAAEAMDRCIRRTMALLPECEFIRDAAYAAKTMSDIALDWSEGRRGAQVAVSIDARQQILQQLGGLDMAALESYLARLCDGDSG